MKEYIFVIVLLLISYLLGFKLGVESVKDELVEKQIMYYDQNGYHYDAIFYEAK